MKAIGAFGYQIPAPAMVDTAEIANALKQDSQIRQILDLANKCRTAIFSVGNLEWPSVLYEMGVLCEEEYLELRQLGAVGDCCSHFLNRHGQIFDEQMDGRVVGTSLDAIKKFRTNCSLFAARKKSRLSARIDRRLG